MEQREAAMSHSTTRRERIHRLVDDVPEAQLARVERLLANVVSRASGDSAERKRPWSVSEVLGLAATDAPPPTDDDVRRWLEERRIEKFG